LPATSERIDILQELMKYISGNNRNITAILFKNKSPLLHFFIDVVIPRSGVRVGVLVD